MKTASCLVGFMAGTASLAAALALFRGALIPSDAWISLAGGGLVAGLAAWQAPAGTGKRWGWADGLMAVAFTLFAVRSFAWLIYWNGETVRFASAYNLGDLSLHITFIRHIASGAPFWPDNPIYPGQPLRYPLGVDLFNATLVAAGADWMRSLIWVGFAGSLAAFLALRRWGGAFVVAAFLFNGGLAGFDFFRSLHLSDYQSEMAWKNFALTMFVPQRGLLHALPAGLLLLASWRARFFGDGADPRERPLPTWFEALLYGTMPLFHLHTFLFLSLLLAGLACFAGRKKLPAFAALVGLAFLPATALVALVAGFGGAASGLHWKPGWMQGDENPLWFWAVNFGAALGLIPVLAVAAAARLRQNRVAAAFVLPAFALFLLSCFLMFSRWDWDNTKLMLWCYLVLMAFLWSDLLRPLSAWARAAACGLLFLSGAVSLAGGLGPGAFDFRLASRPDLDGVGRAVRDLPFTARFAAAPEYNHPLLLSGRKCLVGYSGHLWSYGIPYEERAEKLRRMMSGTGGWRSLARELEADFLFWGKMEETLYAGSRQPWRGSCPVVASGPWGTIYDLRPLRGGG